MLWVLIRIASQSFQNEAILMSTPNICFYGELNSLSHLSAHVVNRLLRENLKTIPKFLSGKRLF